MAGTVTREVTAAGSDFIFKRWLIVSEQFLKQLTDISSQRGPASSISLRALALPAERVVGFCSSVPPRLPVPPRSSAHKCWGPWRVMTVTEPSRPWAIRQLCSGGATVPAKQGYERSPLYVGPAPRPQSSIGTCLHTGLNGIVDGEWDFTLRCAGRCLHCGLRRSSV
ncbi:hypothetical protein CB1_000467006 [Camelus ferus]|nr:hypothetical protein CB1_000467006 [Camelus ferus]